VPHLHASQRWPLQRLQAHQLAALRDLVNHAFRDSAFYRRRFEQAGIRPEDICSFEDLRRLPRLSKAEVQDHLDEIVVPGVDDAPYTRKRTSGSTGTPLTVVVDERAMQLKRAATLRHNRWAGYRSGDAVGLIWGDIPSPSGWRARLYRALVERYVVLDSQRISEAAMGDFCAALRKGGIRCLLGQAQPLFEFACFVMDRGIHDLPVRSVIPTAMALHPSQRQAMERNLGWEVFERYGSEETSIIASECELHRGLHVHAEGLLLEVMRGDRPAAPGEEGELLVTDLLNYAMPLIRYEIGDLVVPGDGSCPCGRSLPVLQRVAGRVADCIVSPEGYLVSGIAITDHLAAIPGIRQAQIVQEELSRLRVNVVPGPGFSQGTVNELRALVARVFGPSMEMECCTLPRIVPDATGKYRFASSNLHEH